MAKPIINPKCVPAMQDVAMHVETAMGMDIPPDDVSNMVASIIRNTAKNTASPSDVAVSFTLNGMLSGLGTPLANAAGIVFKAVQEPLNDLVQKAIIEGRPIQGMREVAAGYSNMLNSFRLATSMGKEGWSKAYPLDFNATLSILAKENALDAKDLRKMLVEEVLDYRASLMAKSNNISFQDARAALLDNGYLSSKTEQDEELQVFLNEAYDYTRNAFNGKLSKLKWINIPTKATVAIDEFGKSLFRQYRIGMMAAKRASDDVKEFGGDVTELTNRYIQEVNKGIVDGDATTTLRNLQRDTGRVFGTSEADVTPYQTIKDYSQRQMFQQRLTGMPAGVHKFLVDHPSVRMFVPFMKTPWNITKEGFSYLPAASLVLKNGFPLAAKALNKLVGREYKESMKNLGPYYEMTNRELLSRNLVGAAYFTGIMTMLEEDQITGRPRSAQEAQQWKDQDIPENSIKVGDKWYSYSRVEPVATAIGLMQELKRAYKDYENPPAGQEPNDQVMKGIMYALKANVMQKSFVDGFNQLINGLMQPERMGQTLALAATKPFTPAIMNQVARILDPHERVATTIGEKLQQRVPLLREDLPVEYGLYGEPRSGNTMQEWTSFAVSDAQQTAVQRAFTESGANPVRNNARLKGVGLSTEQLAEYRKRIAEFITPRLERMVSSEGFKRLPASRQRVILEEYVTKFKRPVTERYARELRLTDPEMAAKFREVEMEKAGLR